MVSVLEYFRGSNRQHAVKGSHANKGDPLDSSESLYGQTSRMARMIGRLGGSQTV
jgi:hypothetical protein